MMTTLVNLAAIGVGGAAGAVCRYLLTISAAAIPGGSTLWGTTLANVLGCGLLGVLAEYSLLEGNLTPKFALACRVGFLGSLTTFSTFTAESVTTWVDGRSGIAAIYVAANLVLGVFALFAGAALVRQYLT